MRRTNAAKSKWKILSTVLVCGLAASGCGGEGLDSAAVPGDEELWDEGPPASEGAVDANIDTVSEPLITTSVFQLPFPCGQVWSGQTRENHSPTISIDFNRTDDLGDPVVAAAGGKVTRVDNEGSVSYGRWVEIDHGSGYRTRYAHLSTQLVAVGQSVSKGEKIGTVGSTGGSTGPHLHFELRLDGTPIKPVFDGVTALFFVVMANRDRLAQVADMIDAGKLKVSVAATFPLADGRAAYESGASRRHRPGKTVLVVRD